MDGQCIIALNERLLIVKPGSATGEGYSGLATSIGYLDITSIRVRDDSSNLVIKINTSDYQVTEAHSGEGPNESNFFPSDDPNIVPIAKWTLSKYEAHLTKLAGLVKEARETSKTTKANSAGEQPTGA